MDTETPAGAGPRPGAPAEDEWIRSEQSAPDPNGGGEAGESKPPPPSQRKPAKKLHAAGSPEFESARAALDPAIVNVLDDLLRADFKYVEEIDVES